MPQSKPSPNRGKPPRKAPGGLNKGLYIRTDQDLLDRLDELRVRQESKMPGIVLSRADIARAVLWDAINRSEKESA